MQYSSKVLFESGRGVESVLLGLAYPDPPKDYEVSPVTGIASLRKSLMDLPSREPLPGLVARKLAGEHVMIQYVTIKKGTSAPQHRHPNEQMMVLIEGRVRLQVGDAAKGELTEIELLPGEVIHYPPDMPHGGEALEDCVVLDIFSPPSETTGIDSSNG